MNLGLKALACLLLYPDAALKDNLQEIKEAVAESTLANDQKEALEIFINHMIETPMADLQKEYVATFDIGKKAPSRKRAERGDQPADGAGGGSCCPENRGKGDKRKGCREERINFHYVGPDTRRAVLDR